MASWADVLFNSQDLTELAGVKIHSIDHHKRPKRNTDYKKLARVHGRKLVNTEYAERIIEIGGMITAADRATYETRRDTLLRYLEPVEATLRIPQSSGNRDYIATVEDINYPELPSGGLAFFVVKFVCADPPFGMDTSNTTPISGHTFTTFTSTVNFPEIGGSVPARPIITVTLSAVTGPTSKFIKLTNPGSAKFIKVTRTWAASDILIVDNDAQTVKVNGAAVDFTGGFIDFEPDDTQLTYEDDFTTRTVTIGIVYKKRWL